MPSQQWRVRTASVPHVWRCRVNPVRALWNQLKTRVAVFAARAFTESTVAVECPLCTVETLTKYVLNSHAMFETSHLLPLFIYSYTVSGIIRNGSGGVDMISPPKKTPWREKPRGSGGLQKHRIIKFVVCSFELHSVILTEGRIIDRCYEIWE